MYLATDPMTVDVLMAGQLGFFQRQGFDVAVACSPSERLNAVAAREGVKVYSAPMRRNISPIYDLFSLRHLKKAISDFQPHIVNAGTPKAGLLGMLTAARLGVKSRIYLLRGLRLETTTGLKRMLLRGSELMTCLLANQLISVSHSLKAAAERERLAVGGRFRVLGAGASNGIDPLRFRPTAERAAAARLLREEWKIPEGAPVIGFVGRIGRDKGIGELAEAFQIVSRQARNAHLVLVGPEEAGDPVGREMLKLFRGHPRVRVTGASSETANWYHVFDVLAFPSFREGLPNVPLEAAASERPVVGYAATGTMDAIRDGVTGRLVRLGDTEGFAKGLVEVLARPDLRRAWGRAGREFVMRDFAQDVVWQQWLDLYIEELIRIGGPAPAGWRRPFTRHAA
jgi:glycosyltransferase involved in cell wall biosynthesis